MWWAAPAGQDVSHPHTGLMCPMSTTDPLGCRCRAHRHCGHSKEMPPRLSVTPCACPETCCACWDLQNHIGSALLSTWLHHARIRCCSQQFWYAKGLVVEVYPTGRGRSAKFTPGVRRLPAWSTQIPGCLRPLAGSICPHVPRIDRTSGAHSVDAVVGKTQRMRTMDQCFSPQQEFLLSAFFIVAVNRVGRDMGGPSCVPF